jgi:F0F1-type ATP synthase membrane subunit b/b'
MIVLQVGAVVTIALFLKMLLHKQLEIGMRRIKKLDEDNLAKEAQLNDKLEALNAECTRKLAAAEKESAKMIESAKEESRLMREDERAKAKEEAKRIITGAIKEKEKSLKDMEHKIFYKGLDLSTDIVKRIFSAEDLQGLKLKVSKEVIDAICATEQVRSLIAGSDKAEVITPQPLPEDQKKRLAAVLSEGPRKVNIKFTEDSKVLGGLILKIGEEIIDGSLAYRVTKAANELRENGVNG